MDDRDFVPLRRVEAVIDALATCDEDDARPWFRDTVRGDGRAQEPFSPGRADDLVQDRGAGVLEDHIERPEVSDRLPGTGVGGQRNDVVGAQAAGDLES